MHPCLAVEDILNTIFDHADPEDCNVEKRISTFHSLALTCKAFLDPALDRVWRTQWGIENLIRVLPKDVWDMSSEPNILTFKGDLGSSECLVSLRAIRIASSDLRVEKRCVANKHP